MPKRIYSKRIQLNVFKTDYFNNTTQLLPAFLDEVNGLYGRISDNRYLLLGSQVSEFDVNPDLLTSPSKAQAHITRSLGILRFKWLHDAQIVGGYSSFDAYTNDGKGIIYRANQAEGLYWIAGFSGSGFQQAPAIASKTVSLLNL